MGISNQVLGLLLSLSLLIFLHELGHFFFARLFKTRVEKFYLFFNPSFSLFRAKRFNKKWHFSLFSKAAPEAWKEHPDSTEWGLGWIPLGGYCSIAGMIDETKSADNLPSEPQPWEYRSKKAWQRLLIISGGVLTNFVLALVIFSAILFTWGTETIPMKNAKMGYDYNEVFLAHGFKDGDIITKIDGKDIGDLSANELAGDISVLKSVKTMTVDRRGELVEIAMSDDLFQQIVDKKIKKFMQIRAPFIVEEFVNNSTAKKAGMQRGDSIVSLNDSITLSFSDFAKFIEKQEALKPVKVGFIRNGNLMSLNIPINENKQIGAYTRPENQIYKTKVTEYGFFESIPAGISLGVNYLKNYVSSLSVLFSKKGAENLGGFVSIGGLFPKQWSWPTFWYMTAVLSLILAFMNILPIPALDGGHVMFTLFEMITGRKPSDKFLERAQTVGMILLLLLLIVANGNDILRLIRG